MGQYYKPVLFQDKKWTIYSGDVDGEWIGAKLTEHSWWYNYCCNAIAEKIYREYKEHCCVSVLMWVGDYAEDSEIEEKNPCFPPMSKIWGDESEDGADLRKTNFDLHNKYIVNITTKMYIDCNEYYKYSRDTSLDMVTHPLPLLTALGNGRGGGDYHGVNEDAIGIWAGDIIYITDNKEDVSNYTRYGICFREND